MMREKFKKIKQSIKPKDDGYKRIAKSLIEKVEGFEPTVYKDSRGIATVGAGLNLTDPTVRDILNNMGIDPDSIIAGGIAPEHKLREAKDLYLAQRESLIKSKVGSETFDKLPEHQQAAITSLGFQSLNNLGPKLQQTLTNADPVGTVKEILLGTNPTDDPGTLNRRMEEAYTFGGPLDFAFATKDMSDEERRKLSDIIEKNVNPHTKQDVINKYGSYLQQPARQPFNKIQNILTPSIKELVEPEEDTALYPKKLAK